MTIKTWDGSTNDFNLPQHWFPYGTPQNGDTAVIHNGFAELAFGDLRDAPVDLGSSDPTNPAVFANYDDFLGNVTVHGQTGPAYGPGAYPATYAQMNVSGGGDIGIGNLAVGAVNYSGEIPVSGNLQMYLAPGAQFVSTGSVTVQGQSTFDVHGSATSSFVNDATLFDLGSHIEMQTPVIGAGNINVTAQRFTASDLTLDSYVTGGQQISVNGDGIAPATLELNNPQGFGGGVTLGQQGDLQLHNIVVSTFSYQNDILQLYNQNQEVLASFQLNTASNGLLVTQGSSGIDIHAAGSAQMAGMFVPGHVP